MSLKNDFDNFIATRCEESLLNNSEFTELQKLMSGAYKNKDLDAYSELSLRMQIVVQNTCYKSALRDKPDLKDLLNNAEV